MSKENIDFQRAKRANWQEDNTSSDGYTDLIYHKIAELFYPLYASLFRNRNSFINSIERKLTKSDRSEPVEIYLSAHLGMGFLSGLIISLVFAANALRELHTLFIVRFPVDSYMIEFILINLTVILGSLLTAISISLLGGAIGGLAGVTAATFIPERTIRQRRSEINILLPDAVAFMYCLSEGGMDRIDILRELASTENTYGEVSIEFQRIVHQIDNFSEDSHTAINNVASNTPSEELSEFLNSMLSTITSGGKMNVFLESQMEAFMDDVERTQQSELDNLELFNEIYITLSLIPVMLLIISSFATSMGIIDVFPLLFLSYFVIPIIQLISLLIITGLFQTDYGNGELTPDEEDNYHATEDDEAEIISAGIAADYKGDSRLFDQIYINEIKSRILTFIADPFVYAQENPTYTFYITLPTAFLFIFTAIISGEISLTQNYITENGFKFSFIALYSPLIIALTPYVYFYDVDIYKKGKITDGLSESLNKLANTNEQGITLPESMLITAQDSKTKLSNEFEIMYKKQQLKISLGQAIIEANNKYKIPRLSRIFRIIKSAQGMSSNITKVLKTASTLSKKQDKVIAERKVRTRQQIGVVIIIFLVFIASLVMLQTFIISGDSTMSSLGSGGDIGGAGGTTDIFGNEEPTPPQTISVLLFHGTMIQGTLAGLIAGYIRTGELESGIKYSLSLLSITMFVWWILA